MENLELETLKINYLKLQEELAEHRKIIQHIADGNYQIIDYGRNYNTHNVVEELYSDKLLSEWAREFLTKYPKKEG